MEKAMTGQAVVTRFDRNGRRETSMINMPIITINTPLAPHPPYESCTPTSRSVQAGSHREEIIHFIPYADDPAFPVNEHLEKFTSLEWNQSFDPDLEMIQLETVHQLHILHKIALIDIERMKIFKSLHISHNTGLLWDSMQRDFLHWPGALQVKLNADLAISYIPWADNLKGRLSSILRIFCPNLNCLSPLCLTHAGSKSSYLASKKSNITPESMCLSEGDPCGPQCFRLISDIDQFAVCVILNIYITNIFLKLQNTLPPSPTDPNHTSFLQELQIILNIMPNMYPCQLSILCFRPCQEIFIQQTYLLNSQMAFFDQDISMETSTDGDQELSLNSIQRKKRRNNKGRMLEFVDDKASHVHCNLVEPCAHSGSCSTSQCQCWVNKLHCTLACRCGISCLRQWQPCSCKQCDMDSCPCVQGRRECVPGRCIRCDAVGSTRRPCVNTRMQRQNSKPIEIKSGSHGLGAFAVQDMNANEYIGTYVGEILSNEAAQLTDAITKYNLRNYLFEFSSENSNTEIFDAAYVGNATRFLNHGEGEKENVEASNILVNGEHQIGLFTKKKVKAGTELLLHYGENYWGDHHESDV
ncbi:hypothetical protein F5I97DRAFT_300386 [Phlebopus sp. FC_14]|nr:hypothetical protein F5I97DRAFT_300386 [Phlebopus sp. FC_14]